MKKDKFTNGKLTKMLNSDFINKIHKFLKDMSLKIEDNYLELNL